MGQVQREGIQVEQFLDRKNKIGNIEVSLSIPEILMEDGTQKTYLWARMEDREKREVDAIFPLPLEKKMSFCMRVDHPVLWNAENAFIYTVVIEIKDSEQNVLFEERYITAFYYWEIQGNETCLNGQRVRYRNRMLPAELVREEEQDAFLIDMKKHFSNALLLIAGQKNAFLTERCLEYGIYLIVGGEHLESGRIRAQLEQKPEGDVYLANPDITIRVVKDGALIENRCTFVNTSEYQLVFEVRKEERVIQKGKIHTDIPPGESRFVTIPFMNLTESGEFVYRVALCLEANAKWEREGYEIASGETKRSNFYFS